MSTPRFQVALTGDSFGVSRRLEGQTAWISGAASGIGEATARLFAEEGANVAIADVQTDRGRGRRASDHRGRRQALFSPADVSVEDDVRARSTRPRRRFGGLNILVNCAGIVHVGPLA